MEHDDDQPQMFKYTINGVSGELPTGYTKGEWREIFVDNEESSPEERRDVMLRRVTPSIQVEEI